MLRLSRAPLAVVAVILLSVVSDAGGLLEGTPAAHPLPVSTTTHTQPAAADDTPSSPGRVRATEDPTPDPPAQLPDAASGQLSAGGAPAWRRFPVSPRPTNIAWPFQPSGGVTAIGDSVMVDATPNLRGVLPGISIDAVAGRQVVNGVAAMQTLANAGRLRDNIVIALGTNGAFTSGQLNRLLSLAAGRHVVVLTNYCPYCEWVPQNNDMIGAGCTPDRDCTVADWHALALANRAWFNPDGVHMPIGGIGGLAYAQLVAYSLEPRSQPACPPGSPARAVASISPGEGCTGPG
ncbi:MAG TPA: hypothetical protein VKL22_01385 [Actinomycetota bacterium]|nr:hypothetical protein [Actinomycetota bacterium]